RAAAEVENGNRMVKRGAQPGDPPRQLATGLVGDCSRIGRAIPFRVSAVVQRRGAGAREADGFSRRHVRDRHSADRLRATNPLTPFTRKSRRVSPGKYGLRILSFMKRFQARRGTPVSIGSIVCTI